jgi:hypothetical protein
VLLVVPRLREALGGGLRLPERLAGLQQPLDVHLPLARELVDEPDRDGRLPQCLHLVGAFALAFGAKPLRQLVARGRELVQRQRIETVELLLDPHGASLFRCEQRP